MKRKNLSPSADSGLNGENKKTKLPGWNYPAGLNLIVT